MELQTINTKLCCPFDHAELTLAVITKDMDDNIHEGVLSCRACHRIYPIIKGIPIMSPDEYREPALERPLLDYWQTQIENTRQADTLPEPPDTP